MSRLLYACIPLAALMIWLRWIIYEEDEVIKMRRKAEQRVLDTVKGQLRKDIRIEVARAERELGQTSNTATPETTAT